jgi:hypothetical protein
MRFPRTTLVGVAAGLLLSAALLVPATPAMATGNPVLPPADCTATFANSYTSALTCTGRPAGQQWQSYRDCTGVWLDSGAFGDIVTGNGTSTAVCPPRAHYEGFVFFQAL